MNTSRTPLAAALALGLALPATATAQVADQWRFAAQLYAYLPTLSAQSTFPSGSSTPNVSVDADKLLDNLEFVFMGSFEARKGRWGAFTDVIYMDVDADRSGTRDITIGGIDLPATASADVHYGIKGLVWTLAGVYGVHATKSATLDVLAGARLVDLDQDVRWNVSGDLGSIPAPGRSGESNLSRANWDAIVGVKGRVHFGPEERWFVPYYLDVGTGESQFTWQAMAGVGYSWQSVDVVAAWRYLDYDLGSGKPFSELSLNGPSLSVVFRW